MFLYVPIVVMMVMSFNASAFPTVWGGFSLKWYSVMAEKTEFVHGAINTLVVAFCASMISTVLGTMLALGIARREPSSKLDAFLMAPMIIPDIVLAIALLSFYTLLKFSLGLHSIIMGHVVFNIAFVFAVVRTRLKDFDYSLVEASIDLGAGAFTTFRRVTLPIIMPGVIAGALLAFTLSFDEFIVAFFTAGPRPSSMTLSMHIYSMLRFGVKPEINAVATVLIFISFVLVLLAQRTNKGVQ